MLKKTYKKLMKSYPKKCIMIQGKLEELAALEEQKCASLDQAAEPFAKLMEEVFSAESLGYDSKTLELLGKIGYHTGKWIYLIDAYDDLAENAAKGSYNPLLLQWDYQPGKESMTDFRERIKERIEFNLLFYHAELSKAWDQLDVQRNRELTENIIYSGLLRKTEEILKKGTSEDENPMKYWELKKSQHRRDKGRLQGAGEEISSGPSPGQPALRISSRKAPGDKRSL